MKIILYPAIASLPLFIFSAAFDSPTAGILAALCLAPLGVVALGGTIWQILNFIRSLRTGG